MSTSYIYLPHHQNRIRNQLDGDQQDGDQLDGDQQDGDQLDGDPQGDGQHFSTENKIQCN